MKKLKLRTTALVAMGVCILFLGAGPGLNPVWADAEVEALKKQLGQLTQMMEQVQKQLADIESQKDEDAEAIDEIDERLNQAEMHTATDKLSLGVELRSRADSVQYDGVLTAPSAMMASFFTPVGSGGFNGASASQIQSALHNMHAAGMVPAPEESDVDNDLLFTNRFRLNMKAKINSQLSFAGRLAAYKVWGDSAEVQFYNGSMGNISMDGTTSSLPSGDTIHLERAYFNYKHNFENLPANLSFGRRPSTEGPPLEYGEYSLEGGSPLAHIINWQFDGASLSFGLEDVTGIPGTAFKLCYGVGFESGFGNSGSMDDDSPVDDVNMFGFIATMYDDDTTSAVLNFAHAPDITDGFTGQTVMPFTVAANADGTYSFSQNTGAFISRTEPTTNIGDWTAATLLLRTNLSESFNKDIDLFISFGWSHTSPDRMSNHPFYGLMGYGLLNSNGEMESRDGFSLYAGAIFPMPYDARLGIEYNWGSKYWFNFTGAEDSLVDSKLAARGHVFESYYIQPVFGDNFFIKLGGRYYKYDYTGSGNPLGEPVKISEANALDTLFPVVEDVWNVYLSATVRF